MPRKKRTRTPLTDAIKGVLSVLRLPSLLGLKARGALQAQLPRAALLERLQAEVTAWRDCAGEDEATHMINVTDLLDELEKLG